MEKNKPEIVIDFEPISRRIFLDPAKSLYQNLIKSGIPVRSVCGGKGSCGKCKVKIQTNNAFFNDPSDAEKKILPVSELKVGWRLACQAQIKMDQLDILKELKPPQIRVLLPEEFLIEDFKILVDGVTKRIDVNPTVDKIYLEVEHPSLQKPTPDLERILSALLKKHKKRVNIESLNIALNVLRKLSDTLRERDHKITLTVWNKEKVIDCEPGDTTESKFGIAFDIGTTTIVGYLMNLNDGKIYSINSKLNPQTTLGEDVITRLTYVKDVKDGLEKLHSLVLETLNEIVQKNCVKAKIDSSKIYEATIVGNSVMHHLFLKINPMYIGVSPYVPAVQRSLNFNAKDLNLNINPSGNVFILPTIAGFVGADTVGVILASEIEKEPDLTLVIDIGTNGEIVIGNKNFLATGSCAAGSALEGAHIGDGMRAAAGSIDTVKIDPNDLSVSYTTIKDKKPIGICGSGLIDCVAEMLKAKIITRSGNFNKELLNNDRIIKDGKELKFLIVKSKDTASEKDITLSQNDIRQLQMAKAAFYSGAKIILKYINFGTTKPESDIKQIFLAGAFGTYINKDNAKFIGMIPDIDSNKVYQIGNAAGIGAQYCLLNQDSRKKARDLLNKIQYVEIATKKEFQKEYAEAMYFPHFNLDLFPSLNLYKEIPKR